MDYSTIKQGYYVCIRKQNQAWPVPFIKKEIYKVTSGKDGAGNWMFEFWHHDKIKNEMIFIERLNSQFHSILEPILDLQFLTDDDRVLEFASEDIKIKKESIYIWTQTTKDPIIKKGSVIHILNMEPDKNFVTILINNMRNIKLPMLTVALYTRKFL
jgi:hypothetical protein